MQYWREGKYIWTGHAAIKMRHYRLTPSRVKRVIRYPVRVEEGILEGAVAAMQPAGGKQYSEIWTMYTVVVWSDRGNLFRRHEKIPQRGIFLRARSRSAALGGIHARETSRGPSQEVAATATDFLGEIPAEGKKIKVITAWRYPGKAPEHDPVPQEILREIRKLI